MIPLEIPSSFKALREPIREKVYYGGRGGAKSHNLARTLLSLGVEKPLRIVCAREIQTSLHDSVYELLCDIIRGHKMESFYDIQHKLIKGINGTQFKFRGLKHNTTDMKSLEGCDIIWVEEAENVSDASWEIVIPTIRKKGSQIWVSFNPKYPTDPTYRRFVTEADENTFVKKVSFRDNPFFPDELERERIKLQKNDPAAYKHIWEGEFDTRHFGGIYASYVDKARQEDRISAAPYKDGVNVITAWDLGRSDSTCIWFAQVVGLEPRIIDYYENNQEDLAHYANFVKSKKYKYGTHYLPHDASHKRLGMAGASISEQLKGMGINNKVLGVGSKASRIELGRSLIKECYMDEVKCKEGIHALMNYQYEWDDKKNMFKKDPLHDWASDGADAFGYLAQALMKESKKKKKGAITNTRPPVRRTSWMG